MNTNTNNGLRVLFLPPGPAQTTPWFDDVVNSLDSRHSLLIFNTNQDVKAQLQNVDVVIDFGGKLGTREMADAAAGRVRLWQILGTGFDHFDLSYWKCKQIPVANCPGYLSSPPLADCALMFMLMLARRWHESQTKLREGGLYNPVCSELEGRNLGLIGFGASARELALKVRPFRMRVSAIDIREVSPGEMTQFSLDYAGTPEDMDKVIAEVDYLSLHLHLNAETRHLMDARRIGLMKPGAYLINVARGALVDECALLNALQECRIGGAGLDVFASEPPAPNNPLLALSNVVATPHIAGVTDGTSRRRAAFVAANVDRVADGFDPLSRVDG